MKKWMTPELGQTKYKISLEYLVPESKEVLQEGWEYARMAQKSS